MAKFYFIIVTVLLFEGAIKINGDRLEAKPQPNGRLLTPDEGCGYTKVKNTRIGGKGTRVGAWPWVASLGYHVNNNTVFHCGGSLITSRHVLTVGHCLRLPGLKFVRLGARESKTSKGVFSVDVPIVRAKAHEDYNNENRPNDIAILYLARDVDFSDQIRPICLPVDEPVRSRKFIGTNPWVAGWGYKLKKGIFSPVLNQLQVPIVNNRECKSYHLKIGVSKSAIAEMINDHTLCGGTHANKGAWQGDSGNPLMLPIHENGKFPFYQIGIVSCAFTNAQKTVPTVYTKVQSYADWIKKRLKE